MDLLVMYVVYILLTMCFVYWYEGHNASLLKWKLELSLCVKVMLPETTSQCKYTMIGYSRQRSWLRLRPLMATAGRDSTVLWQHRSTKTQKLDVWCSHIQRFFFVPVCDRHRLCSKRWNDVSMIIKKHFYCHFAANRMCHAENICETRAVESFRAWAALLTRQCGQDVMRE